MFRLILSALFVICEYQTNIIMADERISMKKRVQNDSVEIYAEAFGNAENVPVLLIAGAMAPAAFWETDFCNNLASHGYYVIRFDNRDIGRSSHFKQSEPNSGIELPYSISDMVQDAKSVLEAYTNRKAHIVGHSLGGSIAQIFAVKYHQSTRTITAIASPIIAKGDLQYVKTDPKITEEIWKILMSNPMHQDTERGIPEFLKIWCVLNGDWPLDKEMAIRYTHAIYETEIIGPAWNHTNVQSDIPDIFTDLKRFNKPILFIHGEKDYLPSHPQNTIILAKLLPKSRAILLKGGGHMFFNKEIWKILVEQLADHMK